MAKRRKLSQLGTGLLAAIEVGLAAAVAIAINALDGGWPADLSWIPLTPARATVALIAAAIMVAVIIVVPGGHKPDRDPPSTGTLVPRVAPPGPAAPPLAANSVAAPTGLHNLPPPSAVFVGRDLDQIGQNFRRGVGVIAQAVHGLGGVGKTELALHYAHDNADFYPLRWWITADTPDNISDDLAALTERLNPGMPLPPADARAWAITYLQTHPGWLLVLDNVDDLADITDLLGHLTGQGHILITTRRDLGNATWTHVGLTALRLDALDRTASLDLLARLAGPLYQPEPADHLANALGDLPLAMKQAAAYITQNASGGISGYLRLLDRHPATMYATPAAGSPEDRAVAHAWTLTTTAITDQNPLARRILDVLAYLAPDNLPEHVFTPLADEPQRNTALALLASYSMITRSGGTISVHRLVQAITRDATTQQHDPTDGAKPLAVAVDLLAEAAPPDPISNVDGWPTWRTLLSHIDTATGHLPSQHRNAEALYLLDQAATFHYGQGQLAQAIPQFEATRADRQRVLGPDHPDTLTSRNNLANAYREAGKLDTAIPMFEATLADRQRELGPDHPDTLTSRNDLAVAFQLAGLLDTAIPMFEATLADRQRELGPDHPDTLTSRNHLGYAYETVGQFDKAIALFEATLAGRLRVLGPDHPDTLISRYNAILAPPRRGRRVVLAGVGVAVIVAALGLGTGLLWRLVTPRLSIIKVDGGFIYADPAPEQAVAADAWFTILGLAVGFAVALLTWLLLRRHRGIAVLIGLVVGSLAGAWLGWWLGIRLDAADFEAIRGTTAVGTRLNAPLALHITDLTQQHYWPPKVTGVVAAQALMAAATYTTLAGFAPRSDLRPGRRHLRHIRRTPRLPSVSRRSGGA